MGHRRCAVISTMTRAAVEGPAFALSDSGNILVGDLGHGMVRRRGEASEANLLTDRI